MVQSRRNYVVSVLVLIVFVILLALVFFANNSLPFFNTSNFAPKFNPQPSQVYTHTTQSPDHLFTAYHPLSRIENVSVQNFLLTQYVEIKLRPRVGAGFAETLDSIQIPSNLKSTGNLQLLPTDLKTAIGKSISMNIIYKKYAAQVTLFDVAGWQVMDLD